MDYEQNYQDSFNQEYDKLFQIIRTALENEQEDRLPMVRFNDSRNAVYSEHSNYHLDSYITVLFNEYDAYNVNYNPRSITTFITKKFIDTKNRYIQQNYESDYLKLGDKEIVELLGRRDAYQKVEKAITHTRITGEESIDEVITKIKEYDSEKEIDNLPPLNKTQGVIFNENRQVIAIYFLLKTLGMDDYRTKADIARVIHLIAAEDIKIDKNGKEDLDNSRIYKRVQTEMNKKRGKNYIEDLKFVRSIFENLKSVESTGIQNILKSIDKDLTKSGKKNVG